MADKRPGRMPEEITTIAMRQDLEALPRAALEGNPGDTQRYQALVLLSEIAVASGDDRAAIAYYNQAEGVQVSYRVLSGRAGAHLRQRDFGRAEEDFRAALNHKPEKEALEQLGETAIRARVMCKIGECLFYQRRPEEAKDWFYQAIETEPGDGYACFFLADLLEREGNIDLACVYAETALQRAFSMPDTDLMEEAGIMSRRLNGRRHPRPSPGH